MSGYTYVPFYSLCKWEEKWWNNSHRDCLDKIQAQAPFHSRVKIPPSGAPAVRDSLVIAYKLSDYLHRCLLHSCFTIVFFFIIGFYRLTFSRALCGSDVCPVHIINNVKGQLYVFLSWRTSCDERT